MVEATVPDSLEPSHQEWEKMVVDKGYSFALFDGLNRFYAHDNEPELLKRLSVPVIVFDRWNPVAWGGWERLRSREMEGQAAALE